MKNPALRVAVDRFPRIGRTGRRFLSALVALVLLAGGTAGVAHAEEAAPAAGPQHTVTYDGYSFMIDGNRTYVWSGEFHYYRLPSPALWRDVLTKMKAAGYNATSIYFDWAYHSPKKGVYDFTGIRDLDKLLSIAEEVGIYVIARPGPYINAEVDSGGFPGWMTTEPGRARSSSPEYMADADEWLTKIDAILARHQLTNGTGTVLMYQVENEFYDNSAQAREYMTHLEQKARADGITVPLVGNHNATFRSGAGALDVDFPDSYPQLFNCANPTKWAAVQDYSGYRTDGKPLGVMEFQGGSFDPWGGVGYDKCREMTGADFEKVFYKHNIAEGMTLQNFYMTYGGTSTGWQADPSQVYSSYDYGAPISESRQLTAKYDEDKRIGYFTQAVAPLTKTDPLGTSAPDSTGALVDSARINPDDHTQFHTLRHSDSTSTAKDTAHIALDMGARPGYTNDDADTTALTYTGTWTHAADQDYTTADYKRTESFTNTANDSVTVPFTGTGVRWISSKSRNHGIADVYLDGAKVATVDGFGTGKQFQQAFYEARGLANGPHTLKIVATGTHSTTAEGNYVVVDAIDVRTGDAAYYPSVPQQAGTALTFAGRDSKILVANYQLGDSHLQYSTSEIMTHARIADRDVAVLYGRSGEAGETVLHYAAKPTVKVLSGDVASTWDATRGDLRLNYTHSGLARVLVTGGPRPLLLLLGTDEEAATFWQQQTTAGPVLVRGPSLLRKARQDGNALVLQGDAGRDTEIEVFAAPGATIWNGASLATEPGSGGSRVGKVSGPKPVTLPELTDWRSAAESPETSPGFDDSSWQVAGKMTTNSSSGTPALLPVLYADDYGFHYGDVWYRGRFRATGKETGIKLSAITGRGGIFSVWLNGTFLGSDATAGKSFTFPAGTVHAGSDNVLSVLVQNSGHNEDYNHNDTHKEARGLTAALMNGAQPAITWRIQGSRGGEALFDAARGPMNNGGLYGERAGWSLPGFPDGTWKPATLPLQNSTPGVTWYRTTVNPNLPAGQDTSVGLRIDDDPAKHYRAEIFVNGWQLGRYINDLGPQHSFPIPAGILRSNEDNSIALAVWNTDASTGGLGTVKLESYGSPVSKLTVPDVWSPKFDANRYAIPAAPKTTVSLTAPDAVQSGQSVPVSAAITVASDAPAAKDVTAELALPTGWTATATSPTTIARIPAGETATVTWLVTEPSGTPAAAVLTATANYTQGGKARTSSDGRVVGNPPTPPTATTAVSAMAFLSETNGWGPVERNKTNGESGTGDGGPITIAGTAYTSGLGAHADSTVSVYVGGHCSQLTAVVGVDDDQGNGGSVTFSVRADGTSRYDSPKLTGASAGVPISVDVSGAQVIDLVVGDGGDGNGQDHADWADAKLVCT